MNRMDQHLKERLVGAAVLVVLGMLVIPSLLDGPPEDEPVRIGLELPAPGEEGKAHTIRLDMPPERRQSPEAGSIARPVASAEPAEDASRTEETPSARDAPEPRPATPKAAPGPESQPPQPSSAESPAPAPTAAPASTPGWAVQVGSFSNADNARKLSRTLRQGGFDVYVSRVETAGRTMHRVRAGPVPDKASAEALAARLRAGGYTGRVVAEDG